jgi:hypothetical protein
VKNRDRLGKRLGSDELVHRQANELGFN